MRLLALSALFVFLASCDDPASPTGLRLTLALDKTQVARDDSVEVTLTATNFSRRPITVFTPDTYGICRHAFQIEDEQKRSVTVMEALCAAVSLVGPQPLILQPGASVTARDYWKPAESHIEGQPVPVGAYRLFGRYDVEQSVVLTAPQRITLTP